MFLGLGVALAVDGGRLPSPSYVPVAIAAPILATFGTPLLTRATRPAFRLPRRATSRSAVALEAPAAPPTSRWVTWPHMAVGLFAGMGLLGSLQGGDRLGGLGLCAVAFGAAVAFPTLRPVLRRARAASSAGTFVLLGTIAVFTGIAFAATVATRHVPAEGAFVLGLYLLAASALVLNADSRVRRRRLTVWVASCAVLAAGCGLAALAGGHTQGQDAAFVGPLATWAGAGLFGLLLTPLLARMRSPRRLLVRP
jgi:hypothetical protein